MSPLGHVHPPLRPILGLHVRLSFSTARSGCFVGAWHGFPKSTAAFHPMSCSCRRTPTLFHFGLPRWQPWSATVRSTSFPIHRPYVRSGREFFSQGASSTFPASFAAAGSVTDTWTCCIVLEKYPGLAHH